METISIKTLAHAVLQGNRQGNQKETRSFLAGKNRKPEQQEKKLPLIPSNSLIPVDLFSEWQADLCEACGDFNSWRGCCPVDLDQCLITKIIESGGNLDRLRGIDLGQGVTTDQVIDEWLRSNEPEEDLINKPLWLICLAEHFSKGEGHV